MAQVWIIQLNLLIKKNPQNQFVINISPKNKERLRRFQIMSSLEVDVREQLEEKQRKRIEKIKDTGKILPGHGGIFDRIDGLMFVSILAFIFYYIQKI